MTAGAQPGSTLTATGRSRARRLVRLGTTAGLCAVVALTGVACRRGQSTRSIDPAVQAWYDNAYLPAVQDMSNAASGEGKPLKDGCRDALEALKTHEAKLVDTPDDQLNQLVQEYVNDRKAAYEKCSNDGIPPEAGSTGPIQRRVNELNQQAGEAEG